MKHIENLLKIISAGFLGSWKGKFIFGPIFWQKIAGQIFFVFCHFNILNFHVIFKIIHLSWIISDFVWNFFENLPRFQINKVRMTEFLFRPLFDLFFSSKIAFDFSKLTLLIRQRGRFKKKSWQNRT